MDSTALEEVRSHRKKKKKQGREQQQEPDLSAACPDSATDSSQVNEKLGHTEAMDNTASVDVMTYNYKKKKKHKIKKELEEEPTLLASAHLSPAESGQVNEKLGHSEAMDNTSVDVMTHKKKRKKHKKEKELEEEPTVLASAQCSPADSGQVNKKLGHSEAMDNTSVDVMTHKKKKKKHKKEKEIKEEPTVLVSALCSPADSDQVDEKLGHAEAMDNTSVDVMTHKKQKKHKKEKELEEEPTVVASAQYSPADSGQVNEKLGHAEAMDNTSVDVMTHKKKKKKHKKEELEEEPTLLASAQCSPADSGQVNEKLGHAEAMDNTSVDVMTHKKEKKKKKHKKEEPTLLASAQCSPADSGQVNEKLGHAEAMDNTSVDVMTHKKKKKKHKKEEPTLLASTQCSPADSDQVPDTDMMESAQPVTLTAGTHSKKRKRKLQEDSALSCSVKSRPMASSPTGSTGCADAAQHVLSVTARRHKKRKKGSRAPEDSDMHPSADCGQMPSGTGCPDAPSLILPVAVRKHKERKKDKGAQGDSDGRRETADRTTCPDERRVAKHEAKIVGPAEFTTKTETDRSSKRLTGSVESTPCHLTEGIYDFAHKECVNKDQQKQKKKSKETFQHQPDQDPFFGTIPGSGTPEADHDVEVLDVPRQQGEQRNISPKKRKKEERQLRPGNHRLPQSFPVEENHDKDTKDASKQKRQLQTTFTGDSSDTDLGKTKKSESEVEPVTSGVGESHRHLYENHVEKFDAKGTVSQSLPTTKECGQSWVCYLCEKTMDTVEDYKTHLGNVHRKRMFQCERCEYTFGYSEGLRVHTYTCKSTRIMIRTFRCTICLKSYSQPRALKEHLRVQHGVGKRTFQCFRCHKHFTYSNSMNLHLRQFCEQGRGEDEKKRMKMIYECNVCSKVYASSTSLIRHVKNLHDHRVRWTCICAATFPNAPAYYYHKKKCIIKKKLP